MNIDPADKLPDKHADSRSRSYGRTSTYATIPTRTEFRQKGFRENSVRFQKNLMELKKTIDRQLVQAYLTFAFRMHYCVLGAKYFQIRHNI